MTPLKEHLREPFELRQQVPLWNRIRATRRTRKTRRRASVAGAAALAAAAVWLLMSDEPALQVDGVVASGEILETTDLSDGSQIEVRDDTVLEILDNGAERFSLVLREGAARFRVTPGGRRRWMVEAGAVSIEVVGTIFDVERSEDAVRVAVYRGAVLVRAAELRDGVQRLGPGDSVRVPVAHTEARSAVQEEVEVKPEVEPEVARAPRHVAPAPPAEAPSPPPMRDALERADELRLGGQNVEAAEVLEEALRRAPRGRGAGLARFVLGRIYAGALRQPFRGAESFEAALALDLPRALREDAMIRATEAFEAAGSARAERMRARYLESFPEGRARERMGAVEHQP